MAWARTRSDLLLTFKLQRQSVKIRRANVGANPPQLDASEFVRQALAAVLGTLAAGAAVAMLLLMQCRMFVFSEVDWGSSTNFIHNNPAVVGEQRDAYLHTP